MRTLVKSLFTIVIAFMHATASAASTVYSVSVDKPVSEVYGKVYKSLEDARFYVVFEPNIGNNLSGFAERWGDEYNQSQLSEIRSMVFCNVWYTNQVSNKDPEMLALCPLHMTLIEKDGRTTALFARPTAIAADSPAHGILQEVEEEVIRAINSAMQ